MSNGTESPLRFRRTKIVATLGPASSHPKTLTELVAAGVNVFRLNMSHGTHEEHRARYANARSAALAAGREIAILADLSGPKIRVGTFAGGSVTLLDGENVTVTTRQVVGGPGLIVSQYASLADDAVVGDRLLLDDGNIELLVESISGADLGCRVLHGGILKDKKGMNLPGVKISAPALTQKDRADALFACELGVDFIALSFVRRPSDVAELRALISGSACQPWIIAKIEKPEALTVVDGILAEADGIMVARGDLGVELEAARVPNVQEELVDAARAWKKPVIVATQMLESMITQARPTRAEMTDVANAVRSGADAVMLSAETAAGNFPVEAVRTMDLVIRRTEDYLYAHGAFVGIDAYTPTRMAKPVGSSDGPTVAAAALAAAAARMSRELRTSAIVADATSSRLLVELCAERPAAMVLAVGGERRARSFGCLAWGVECIAGDIDESRPLASRAAGLLSGLNLEHSGGFLLVATSEGESLSSLAVLAGSSPH